MMRPYLELPKMCKYNQPTMYYSSGNRDKPLLVGLHTWSCDYTQVSCPYAQWCIDYDWGFIYPNFHGPNSTPQGCGSELVLEAFNLLVNPEDRITEVQKDILFIKSRFLTSFRFKSMISFMARRRFYLKRVKKCSFDDF